MPSYFPDPWEHIKARREEGKSGGDLFAEGLDINFGRKPWDPLKGKFEEMAAREEEQYRPLTPGDPEFNIRDYLIAAQVPSAAAEAVQFGPEGAAAQAQAALDKYGEFFDAGAREKLEAIAQTGQAPRSNPFFNILNTLDTLGEQVRLGILDISGADEKAGVEVEPQDYMDAFLGREANVRERLGADLVGEDQFLSSGSKLMENLGVGVRPGDTDVNRAVLGFLADVALDPLSYVSFGTVGLGKKVAIEAAEAGITRAGREAVEAVARGGVRNLTDPASRELADRITQRIAKQVDDWGAETWDDAIGMRDRATRQVLAEERRALDAAEGVRSIRTQYIDDAAEAIPYIPRGTVIEDTAGEIFKDLANKEFRGIADKNPWFTASRYVPTYAKGGIQLGLPFGRKRFPFLRIPGTETNRLASRLLGRKPAANLFSKLPEKAQVMFRNLGERAGVEQAVYAQAREGSLWRHRAVENVRNLSLHETFTSEALRPLAHGITSVSETAAKNGVGKDEASRLMRAWMAGDTVAIESAPQPVQVAIREAIDGENGIRQVLKTFHDAARRVGMNVGFEPNYVPTVATRPFGKFLDAVASEGVDIPLGRGSSDLSNLGMAVIARYAHNTGEGLLGASGTNPVYSQFAQSNNVTRIFRAGLAGDDMAADPNLLALIKAAGGQRLSADLLNDAIGAAMDDLVRMGRISRSKAKAVSEGAFHTDLEEIFTQYTSSMGEAIQMAALLRELKRYQLIRDPARRIAVSQTLTSVHGRLTDEVAEWVEKVAAGEGGANQAARLVTESVGGRKIKVPLAVTAHPAWPKTVRRMERVFSRLDSRGNEIAGAIQVAEAKYLADGWPSEIASKLALAEGDSDIALALSDLANMALDEVSTLHTASLEMAARQVGDAQVLTDEAVQEGRRILAGAEDSIAQLEELIRRKLGVRAPEATGEVIDVTDRMVRLPGKQQDQPLLSGLAEMFEALLEKNVGAADDFISSMPQRALSEASPTRLAQEAAFDLGDRLTVADVTVGDYASFSNNLHDVLMVLSDIDQRLNTLGYQGVASLTDEMRAAAAGFVEARSMRRLAERELEEVVGLGGLLTEGESVSRKSLQEAVVVAKAAEEAAAKDVARAAAPLRESSELMGDLVDHAAQTVESPADSILKSRPWQDVWGVAVHKTPDLPKEEFTAEAKELAERGLKSPTKREITERGSKSAARLTASQARAFWGLAIDSKDMFAEAAGRRMLNMAGGYPVQRVLGYMKAGDTDALVANDTVFRTILANLKGPDGKPFIDPARFAWRENGRLVIEPEQIEFIGLSDVMDDIRSIVDQPKLPDLEAVQIAKETWDLEPDVIQRASPKLDTFFRQVDAAGGLPQELEDYAYLRNFTSDLKAVVGDAPKAPKRTTIDKIIDEAAAVMRREAGHGPRARKLDTLWDASREQLEKELPPEAWERLNNLVSTAVGSREVGRNPAVGQLRGLIGSVEEAQDNFVRDIARLRHESMDGGAWSESVIEDVLVFRSAFERLMRHAPGDRVGLRAGAEELAPLGGEVSQALDAYRQAGRRLTSNLRQAEKKPQLASFLPELPEGIDDLPAFAERMKDEMLGWRTEIKDIPTDGYVNPKVADLVGEDISKMEMTPGTALMLEHLAASATFASGPLGLRLAAESVREVERWWKSAATVARPTFVPRNLLGGILNGLMIGVGPRHYAAVRTNVMRFKRAWDETGLLDEALKAVDSSFRPYMEGLQRSGLLSTTFANTIDRLRPTQTILQNVNPKNPENILFRGGAKFMETSEDFLRAAAFVRWYDPKNPATMKLAKEMALVAHFDYSALTSLETKIKRFIPFFVWTRRNLPLQMRMMVEQPGTVTRLLHAQQNAEDTWGDSTFVDDIGFAKSPFLSAFAVDTPFIMNEDTPYWQRLIIDPQIPTADLEDAAKAFGGGWGGITEYLFRMVSPVYSAPFESNPDGDLVAAPTGLREIMMATEWLGADHQTSGEQYLANPLLARLFSTALPFLGEWVRTAGIVPSGSGGQIARQGYNIEDGIQLDERAIASLLSLGRAAGAQLQTPADARAAGYEAIFEHIEPAIDELHRTGQLVEPEDIEAFITTLLAREGIDPSLIDVPGAPEEPEDDWVGVDADFRGPGIGG